MAIEIETLSEKKFRQGKAFSFIVGLDNVAASEVNDVVICLNEAGGILKSVKLTADSEIVNIAYFAGTEFTVGTGTEIAEIRRNSIADTESNAVCLLNPTITNDGVVVAPPINELGQLASGTRSFIKSELLADLFAVAVGDCILLRLTNPDNQTRNINLNIEIFND